jgi:hypothetical protein
MKKSRKIDEYDVFHKDRGCICQDPRCYAVMKQLYAIDDPDCKNRCGWIALPSLPPSLQRLIDDMQGIEPKQEIENIIAIEY